MPSKWDCPERPPWRRTILVALLTLLLVFATGCETPSLTAAYASANKPELRPMPKPENRFVNLDVRDARPVRDPVLLEALCNHLESGLRARGFHLGNEGTLLEVAIEHHYLERKTGFWLSSESAELIVRCRVGDPDGRMRLDKTFTGRSGTLKITATPPARTRAFEDLLLQLLNDDEYQELAEMRPNLELAASLKTNFAHHLKSVPIDILPEQVAEPNAPAPRFQVRGMMLATITRVRLREGGEGGTFAVEVGTRIRLWDAQEQRWRYDRAFVYTEFNPEMRIALERPYETVLPASSPACPMAAYAGEEGRARLRQEVRRASDLVIEELRHDLGLMDRLRNED